tara:strand:- start:139 stop:1230 length:1092 start_codon:yes stop_codon:yes gene_type:complete
MNIRTFENYINNSELNQNTKKDYIGQYNQIEKILEVNDLTSLLFKEMKLVISALKNKYTDQNYNMGLSSYKKKLDVLKHYNKFIFSNLNDYYKHHISNLNMEKDLDNSLKLLDTYKLRCIDVSNNFTRINNELKPIWKEMSIPKVVNHNVKPSRKHTLKELDSKFIPLYNKSVVNFIHEDKQSPSFPIKKYITNMKNGFARKRLLVNIESCVLFGLNLLFPRPPRDWNNLRWSDVNLNNNTINFRYAKSVHGSQKFKVSGKVMTMIKQYNDLHDILIPNHQDRFVFMESNIGNAVKCWACKFIFEGDKSQSPNLKDLEYINLKNFYNNPRSKSEKTEKARQLGYNRKNLNDEEYYKEIKEISI